MMGRVPTKVGASSAFLQHRKPQEIRTCSHVLGALIPPKPMGSFRPTALLLPPLLLLIGFSASASTGCLYLPRWSTRCLLSSHMDHNFTGRSAHIPCCIWLVLLSTKPWCTLAWPWPCCLCLQLVSDPSGMRTSPLGRSQWRCLQWRWFHFLLQKSRKSHKLVFCRRHKMPTSAQRKLLCSRCLSEKDHQIYIPSPDISRTGLRSKRTQPLELQAVEGHLPRLDSQRLRGPEFSFDLLRESRTIRVTIPPGPEVSVRLCHQWALECEDLSSPFDAQEIVSGGHTVDLPYEFLLPCLCIEAFYLQEDTVRHKKCPFNGWPEAYVLEFWKSMHFTDYSQHDQMIMALKLHCPLKLKASLCQRQGWHSLCEDIPNATARESEGWYVLEKVDLHPQLCFKFSFGNSSHIECPHRTATSWNVSMDTQAQQLILHFSSRTHATFSAAWSNPGSGQDSVVSPVYSVSQTQGSSPVTLDLIIPFLRPGSCVQVWRSDVQFAWKHILCPDVTHRRLGLLILALLALTTLLGIVLVLTRRRLLSDADRARPVLLLHAAESEAQRRLVGALAELLRTALGGGRDVIVDLWEGTRVARVGPLPWLWAARARVARERGTVLLLWSRSGPARGPDRRAAPLCALLRAAPRPLLLLAYFNSLCAKGDIPPSLRALPRYRLLRDLPRLLRALDARPSAGATNWGGLGAQPCLRGRLALCRQLEREASRPANQG
ncbi:interleukin-17 receptor E isoform X2 [Choloepus didactylus]|uniref:interleukin-17 receptor E isoform X2 n=1 Tax=Choloepus didactylus TaxID=27675 RepID=UPI00189C9AE2|nr:interleukin-17 receptor E isoform X2 [Choloepus didactylus]